ncbi:MAG: 4-(cytidine 5'-diphospho)-2-C-methyl-D-erythritol kinase [Candidatus Cloacimonadales bacterium]|nr:4-(cytidine 5'-diphospho)-2-C-methyl-D-erythritol kinase [Candidatus Cloacimonadales bacterium]
MEKSKKRSVPRRSSAKINLFLDVLSKRPDGYHNIRTIFSEIELYDHLNFTLTKNRGIRILSGTEFVSLKKNLIYKVAIFIQEKYNVNNGVVIKLEKNIPVSGGLGGGSSNAAHTILALNDLWELNLTEADQHKIAREFGSDINFFLKGGTALGEGRGEKIREIQDIDIDNIFLVNPGFGISSQEAYQAVVIPEKENENWKFLLETGKMEYCYNALESGICRLFPDIQATLDFMRENGAVKAMLSGSGATMIGFCPNREIAEKFSEYFSKKKYWNCITKTIKRSSR